MGDLGVYSGTSITGIPPGMPVGVNHGSDSVSAQAQLNAAEANHALSEAPCTNALPMHELAGLMLSPGVYCFNAAAVQLTGNLVLDGQGDANAVFVFQIGAAFTTADFATVTLTYGASLSGRAIAETAAISLDTNSVSVPSCP
jgi:hypothetical protein